MGSQYASEHYWRWIRKGSLAAKQAARDLASGEEDKAKAEKAEARREAEKEAEKEAKDAKKAEKPAEVKAEEKSDDKKEEKKEEKIAEPEAVVKAEEKAGGEKVPAETADAPKAEAKSDAPADKQDV